MDDKLSGFNGSAGKKDFSALVAFVKSEQDPAKINAALLAASDNPPFYSDSKEMTAFFIAATFDPVLDAKLLAAAKLSATDREQALDANRVSNKEGAFTNFIYFESGNPDLSKIYKVIRAPHIGPGNGAWGGLKDADDVDVRSTVNREIFEEVIDAIKLQMKIYGGDKAAEIESRFDACLHEAVIGKKDLRGTVQTFINSLDDNDTLRGHMMDLSQQAEYLITDLVAAKKYPLFKCRDDSHAINRGWGFKVDAYAHFSVISLHTKEAFDQLQYDFRRLKEVAELMGIPGVGGEMQGIASYTLGQACEEAKKNFYGHEGFAEIVSFSLLIKQYAHLTNATLWDDFTATGAVDQFAAKMRLKPETLKGIYDTLTSQRIAELDGHMEIDAAAYKEAHQQKPRKLPDVKP